MTTEREALAYHQLPLPGMKRNGKPKVNVVPCAPRLIQIRLGPCAGDAVR